MDDLGIDDTKCCRPGDLVEYIAFHYTPDLYYQDDDMYQSLGVVIEAVHHSQYVIDPWMYRVFWFDTARVSEVPEAHLRIISESST